MHVPREYYRVVASINERSPFLSPTKNPAYVRDICDFLTADGSRHVADVGPGYGEVVAALGELASADMHVWAIDSCPEFLQLIRRRWTGRAALTTLRVDLTDAPPSIADLHRRIDRLTAINVLQDVDLPRTLELFTTWLRPGGRLLATILAKETTDAIYKRHPLYDAQTGRYYKPTTNGPTLGEYKVGKTRVSYERILQHYTLSQAQRAFAAAGLVIVGQRQIGFRATDMIDRWTEAGTLSAFSQKGLSKLLTAGVYIDAHELIAICTT